MNGWEKDLRIYDTPTAGQCKRASLSLENSSVTPVSTLGPLCNCHGCCLNTLHHNNAPGRTSQRPSKVAEGVTHLAQVEKIKVLPSTPKTQQNKTKETLVCSQLARRLLLFKHSDVCLCKVFLYLQQERDGERAREREWVCVLARGAHKSRLEPAAVQCELGIMCVIQQSQVRKKKPVRAE